TIGHVLSGWVDGTLSPHHYHCDVVEAREILEGIENQIPSFRGLKFSGTDLRDLGQCVCYCRPHGWSLLYGVDEHLLGAVVLGVNGAVGSTYNYLGNIMNSMLTAFEKGDIAQARNLQVCLTKAMGPMAFGMPLKFQHDTAFSSYYIL
uniref:N-acetylneuraminate lyase n=1 Tax=Astyanax mexicanus TaxID=7994 RepID=A0A8B9KGI1_ASTMX